MTGKFSKDRTIHLIVGDSATKEKISNLLEPLQIGVKSFSSVESFLTEPLSEVPVCLIVDTALSDTDAATLTKDMRRHGLSTPIIVLADGEHTIATAVNALRVGAIDFMEKPIREKEFLDRIKIVLENAHA